MLFQVLQWSFVFFVVGVHLHSSFCVERFIVSFASSSVRCDLNIRSNNSTPFDVVFFMFPTLVVGVRNIGCFESWVIFSTSLLCLTQCVRFVCCAG